MILFSKKKCFGLVLAIAMQTTAVHATNEPIYYPAGLDSAVNFIKACDNRLFIVGGVLLLIGLCWFIKSRKDQKKPESESKKLNQNDAQRQQELVQEALKIFPLQCQLEFLPYDTDSQLLRQAKLNVFGTPMVICGINNTLNRIQIILKFIGTVDAFTALSDLDQQCIRDLIKTEEEAVEEQYRIRNMAVLSSLPVGPDVERIKSLIENGIPLCKIKPALDFYKCTKIHDVKDWCGAGGTQIDHLLECMPREKLFLEIQDPSRQHVIFLNRAKLYAHLTHHYKEAVICITKMLEHTKTDGLSVKIE